MDRLDWIPLRKSILIDHLEVLITKSYEKKSTDFSSNNISRNLSENKCNIKLDLSAFEMGGRQILAESLGVKPVQ